MILKPAISVCVIGFNEEKKVKDCLASIKDLADEIIFVDSFSTDETIAIVKQFTDKIYREKFKGHVQQKNYAISLAKNDWVLCIDCDERMSEQAIIDITSLWQRDNDKILQHEIRAISFHRLTYYIYRFIKHSGWYPDAKIRLFNRNFCQWSGENPHDRVECQSRYTVQLKSDILHYSFDSISDHLKTIESFSNIAALEAYQRGRKCSLATIIFRSLWVGIRKIFFEFAFLDGTAGIILTGLSMTATWAKYSKLYILNKKENNEK